LHVIEILQYSMSAPAILPWLPKWMRMNLPYKHKA